MKISIITVFPQVYDSFLNTSLIKKAIDNGILNVNLVQLSDMCDPKVRVDAPACGPGAGMVIKPEVVEKAINQVEQKWGNGFKIFFSPQGKKLEQPILKKLSKEFSFSENKKSEISKNDHIILVCARYEGIDQRVEDYYADLVLSVGDFVVMGGDIPAQLFMEAFLRLVPGIIGRHESVEKESFSRSFLDYPAYSLPKKWNELSVPEVLLSGNHAEIEKFRAEIAAEKTILNRFDWFRSSNPDLEAIKLAKKIIPNHYVALMHTQVLVQDDKVGDSSITSLDIHDIARSSATYGISNYFVVSRLKDQQNILENFLEFWMSDEGKEYNLTRFEAVKRIIPAQNFEDVFNKIKEKEGLEPIVITTSAKTYKFGTGPKFIDYSCQEEVFKNKRPVLFVFGTSHGLADEVLKKSDYLLLPVNGMSDYNHLSVRSAVAIILDRWLGLYNKV
jgi:tRNA (guanine37-N1)-methyltransferase